MAKVTHWTETVPQHKDVEVTLTGIDGNAFSIMATVKRALDRAGYGDDWKAVKKEMTSGDYDHLLTVAMFVVDAS